MELITTRQTTAISTSPQCMAIAQRYGDKQSFLKRFVPDNLPAIYAQLAKSEIAEVPHMASIINTYGETTVHGLLQLYILKILHYNNIEEQKIDANQVSQIAELMMADGTFRILNIAFALSFFHEVMMGKYKLYACKPIDFMNAMQEYCNKAKAEQQRLYEEKERIEREQEREKWARESVTFEQFCAMRGLDPSTAINPLTYVG